MSITTDPVTATGNGATMRPVAMLVTPEMAREWLETRNGKNRPFIKKHVELLAEEMRAGRWVENGDTIRFDKDGNLVDGQHRLAACVVSGVPFKTVVVYGLGDVFGHIDITGKQRLRTNAQWLAIARKRGRSVPEGNDANLVAAAAASIRLLKRTMDKGYVTPDPVDAIQHLTQHPGLAESYAKLRGWKAKSICAAYPLLTALHYHCHCVDPVLADSFFRRFCEGDGITKGTPLHTLRRTFEEARGRQEKRPAHVMGAFIIKAWNATREGYTVKLLRWKCDEPYPEIR